jgi:integrase
MAEAGRRPATINRAMTTIERAHRLTDQPSPLTPKVRQVLKGIRRRVGSAQRRAKPLSPKDIVAASRKLGHGRRDLRARAMLLLGFAMGARRSELVALEVADLAFVPDGLRVTIRHSKTDQEGVGRVVHVPKSTDPIVCPVEATRAWLTASRLTSGRIFRVTPEAIRDLVKRAARLAGLDPSGYSAHSLRAGLVTAAVKAGKRQDKIMAQTGHRSATIMAGYIRDATLDEDNAAEGLLDL